MSRKQHHPSVWINVRLDPELDADLIAWLEGQPRGRRSQAVREALRAGIGGAHEDSPATPRQLRQIVADEMAKALAGRRIGAAGAPDEVETDEEIEAKYGDKLNPMLGGISQSRWTATDGE